MAARKDSKRTSDDDGAPDSQDALEERDDLDDEEDDLDDEEDDDLDDDEEDDDEAQDEPAAAGDAEDRSDLRAAEVAKALGLDEEQQAAEQADAEAPKNRAARRRDRAQRRRGGPHGRAGDEGEGEGTPARDRNKRLREQLLERRRQAARQQAKAAEPHGLAPSEMAEDVLVRASASVMKWLARNKALVGWALFGAVAVTAGILYYVYRAQTTTAEASDGLMRAVVADRGIILPEEEDTRTEEQKEYDVRQFYPSLQARTEAALERYEQVTKEHAGTGAAILAELGRAGALLEAKQYDPSIEAYDAVLATELAPVDPDVQGRALEGKAFAQEAKGAFDDAIETAEKLAGVPGFEALGKYHQARLLAAKGAGQDEVKGLLLEARKILEKADADARSAGGEGGHRWLRGQINERLRAIDPSLAPPDAPAMPGGGPDMERLRQMLESRGLSAPQLPAPPGGGAK